jgi:fibrillarin-like rRNA methylase
VAGVVTGPTALHVHCIHANVIRYAIAYSRMRSLSERIAMLKKDSRNLIPIDAQVLLLRH